MQSTRKSNRDRLRDETSEEFREEMELREDEEPLEGEDHKKWSGSNKLLSPRELQKQYRKEGWFKQLNELGKRWLPKCGENDAAWEAQINQACALAYIGLWANGVKYFEYEQDADGIILETLQSLKKDIESFDPEQSDLGKRISSKIPLRIQDAKDKLFPFQNPVAWQDRLRALTCDMPRDFLAREKWAKGVAREAFRFYRERIDSVTSKKSQMREAFREELILQLMAFDPDTQSLYQLLDDWCIANLKYAPEQVIIFSGDDPIREGEGTSKNDVIPDPDPTPEETVINKENPSIILMALAANYHLHAAKGSGNTAVLYAQLNYTEQLARYADLRPLPKRHAQDILKPLEDGYYRYFMDVRPEESITLSLLSQAKLRQVIGTGKFRVEHVTWEETDFLPAKVQVGYLHGKGISSSDSTVSKRRNAFKASILKELTRLR